MYEEFEQWAEVYRKPFIQDTTYIKYDRTKDILKIHFGQKTTSEIKRIELQQLFNKLSGQYEKATIKTYSQQLHAYYQSLVDEGEIERNLMNNIRFSGVINAKKKKYLEVSDAKLLGNKLNLFEVNQLMIYTALKTGMRFAEVLGVTADDLYIENGMHMLSINKTLDYKYTKEFKTTKTETSVREISIDETTYNALLGFVYDSNKKNDESVFGVRAPATLNRLLEKMCAELHIEPISFHGLRHTHGSILLRQGVPMISVSKRLGHASMSITQDVYIHLMQEQENEDNTSIVRILEGV